MTDLRFVYITFPTREEANAVARTTVGERLAACANVLGEITSVFRWEGKVQEESEAAVILKTRAENLPALTERIKSLHSYSVPCIVTWALEANAGNQEFLQWLETESTPNSSSTA